MRAGVWTALALKDARVIYRDGFLLTISLVPLLVALVLRFGVAFVPVTDASLYLAPLVVLLPPFLFGSVLGFALVEEREQGTWLLLRVVPLSRWRWLAYVVGSAVALSSLSSVVASWLYGEPFAHGTLFVGMVLASSLTSGTVLLAMGAYASNQVEGMAISKVMSALGIVPAVAFVLPLPLQLLFVWCPWYWLYLGLLKSFASDPSALTRVFWPGFSDAALVAVPAALSVSLTVVLARRYRRLV